MVAPSMAAALAAATAPAAGAAELTLVRSFAFPGPSGLAYDARFCGLWVANETGEVALLTLFGEELRRFSTDLSRIDAVAMDGGALLVTDGNGRYQRITEAGDRLGPPFRLADGFRDNDGLYVDPTTRDVWLTDDSRSRVVRLAGGADARTHTVLRGTALATPMLEPQGITHDPVSGHILVVDDADALDALFEFAPDGTLLDVIPLAGGDLADAEAITIQPETHMLFIGFDDTDRIATYLYRATSRTEPTSEPGAGGCVISALPQVQAGPG